MIEKRNISLNLNVRGLGESATLRIQQQVRELRAQNRSVCNLGLGQSPFPVPESVVERLRARASEKDYLPVAGLLPLRESIADYLRRKRHVDAGPEEILVGPGSKELLFLLQLCFYGEIVVPTPCWVSYTPQSQIIGRNVRFVPTSLRGHWKVRPDDLADMFEGDHDRYRPRLFVLNSPANPTGITYTAEELQALAKVAREYELLILSDEIYSGLHHTGDHVSIARYYPEGTIIADGISKWCGAGGWRLGAFRFPPDLDWLRETMAAVASETYTTVSAPIQYASVKAFEGGSRLENYLSHARRIVRELTATSVKSLKGAGVRIEPATGAFYLYPMFGKHERMLAKRGIRTAPQLADALLNEAGVATLPGNEFNRPKDELSLRMSLVDFDGAAALSRSYGTTLSDPLPSEFIDQCCSAIPEAMQRITDWLEK